MNFVSKPVQLLPLKDFFPPKMIKARILLMALSLALAGMADVVAGQTTVTISSTASHPIPSTMCEPIQLLSRLD